MELKWLEDFLSLSHFMNFTLAAGDRHITQSALSRRIRQLEEWVGLPLIDRSTYPVRLTPAGESFLPRARKTVEMLIALREETQEQHAAPQDILSFATMSTLVLTFFPVWMEKIEADGESFRTRFTEAYSSFSNNVSKLFRNECDFLLTYAHECVPAIKELSDYPYLTLGSERVIAISAPTDDGAPIHQVCADGTPVNYLSYRDSSFFAQALPKTIFDKTAIRLNTVYENAMSAALKAMAVSGHGVAWIPESLAVNEMSTGQLVRAADPSLDMEVEIRLYRSYRLRSKRAGQFWRRAEEVGMLADRVVP
ncbi:MULTISPECIES: LysR family transcriptional regulator [Rhizobium/Agrobacterium group]|uniref:LysR family transcriptional regulator n=2 Tax=Neorhizobium TaxID=1525371 RepID=A0ABV0M230_9HYPH|nr:MULTISPECIES: LysR family transcriptional regulator [Rhizobium/Agrobacterium group]KGD96553.1 LysR family transcriptional regulator [Rhizobium sp. YS-1r]MCC2611989.1 LysR family transcriptional regulator [Neorhizobium petrolearium]WGI67150.1 LysR family transcriptional regulator [Neorhizobium petrolearium]